MQIGFSKKISENLLEDIFDLIIKNIKKHHKIKIAKFGTFTLRKKRSVLAETLKLKKTKLYQKEMLFCLKLQKNLKNI